MIILKAKHETVTVHNDVCGVLCMRLAHIWGSGLSRENEIITLVALLGVCLVLLQSLVFIRLSRLWQVKN